MYSLLMKSRVLFTIILVLDYGLNPKCILDFKFFYKNDKYKCIFCHGPNSGTMEVRTLCRKSRLYISYGTVRVQDRYKINATK